ncbi:MAG: aspartyl/asparaginyl beta-hydroxylase domain-containing protein [Pseudomonadota bacterium]
MITLTVIVAIFIASNLYIQRRGKVRHKLSRQFADHSAFMAPINCLFYAFSAVPNRPYLDVQQFANLRRLDADWEAIRDEAKIIFRDVLPEPVHPKYDLAFYSFMKNGWNRFYLKWYGDMLPSALEHCPHTVKLLQEMPEIRGAMFTLLPPGGKLPLHRDPYAGSLRYHLGLVTPGDDACRIFVDGEPYSWRDGKSVLFDETFIHTAENKTDEARIILFADVKRPLTFKPVEAFAYLVERVFVRATTSVNDPSKESRGVLNMIFPPIFYYRRVMRRFKAWNKDLYYAHKYVGLAAIAGLVVWSVA